MTMTMMAMAMAMAMAMMMGNKRTTYYQVVLLLPE